MLLESRIDSELPFEDDWERSLAMRSEVNSPRPEGIGERLLHSKSERPHLLPYVCLMVVYACFYVRHAWDLGFYVDDWGHVLWALNVPISTLMAQWPMDYRPFEVLPWFLMAPVFGTHLPAYYLFLFAIDFISACLLYRLVAHITGNIILGTSAAAVWAVYPADSAQFWLTSIHYRLGVLSFLLSLTLLLLPKNRTAWCILGATVSCAISLLCVELFVGLAILVPVAAVFGTGQRTEGARLRQMLPYLPVIGAYAAYRLWLGPHVFHLYDPKVANATGSIPGQVLRMEHLGFAVVLLQAWLGPAAIMANGLFAAPHVTTNDVRLLFMGEGGGSPSNGLFATAAFCLFALGLLLALAGRWNHNRWRAKWIRMRPGALLLLLGFASVAAGLLALGDSATDSANIAGITSRLDIAADIGGALMVTGSLWLVLQWLSTPRFRTTFLFIAATLCVVGLGAIQTEHTAATYAQGWSAERQMWRAVLSVAPAFRPETFILIESTDSRSADIVAAQQPWGIDGALALLYPDERLQGSLLTPAAIASECPAPGFRQFYPYYLRFGQGGLYTGSGVASFVAPSRIIVLRYSSANGGTVSVAPVGFPIAGGRCRIASSTDRITTLSTPSPAWRALVLVGAT